MGSGRSFIEMGISVVMVVGIVCLSMQIMPSSAQETTTPTPTSTTSLPNPMGYPSCLLNIGQCILTNGVSSDGKTVDPTKCCSVIKKEIGNATCFCSIEQVFENMTSTPPSPTTFDMPPVSFDQVELQYNKLFADCDIDTTFDKLCNGESENINGANKVALAGLIPGALLIWALMMFI